MTIPIKERHRILREVYRHYLDFYDFYARTGQHVIEHKGLTISFLDLKAGIPKLSGRKKEAFYLNVLRDMKQKDVAEKMGITTVSVGQYVDAACRQLAEEYFDEDEDIVEW
jgi:DNA-directed RNA polymerase specialized sigma24 family protein